MIFLYNYINGIMSMVVKQFLLRKTLGNKHFILYCLDFTTVFKLSVLSRFQTQNLNN